MTTTEKILALKSRNQDLLQAAANLRFAAIHLKAAPERQISLMNEMINAERLVRLAAAEALLEAALLGGDTEAIMQRQTVSYYSQPRTYASLSEALHVA